MLGWFFSEGKVRPGFFFPRGKVYTGILFPGAILSRGGFSGGKLYAGGNSMLQQRHGLKVTSKPSRPHGQISNVMNEGIKYLCNVC